MLREKSLFRPIRPGAGLSGAGLSAQQGNRKWISGYQSIRLPDIRGRGIRLRRTSAYGTGISEIVHAPNLKNKIGAGSTLILSLRNSG